MAFWVIWDTRYSEFGNWNDCVGDYTVLKNISPLYLSVIRAYNSETMKLLILGLDEGFKRNGIGYTDTIILVSISPQKNNNVMLSIPRDLWISISEKEENRLGAVYRIIEMKHAGKGASTVTALVNKLFQVQVYYYVLVKNARLY